VLAGTVAIAASAVAQTPLPDTPEAFGMVLTSWAARHQVKQTFIVVRHNDRIVYRSSVGGVDPKAPVHLASLSKAITGACVATLIRDGKLSFDTPMSFALAKFIANQGKLDDQRFARVTVAQLLTHRGGFGTVKDDPGSGPALVSYLKTNSATARPSPAFLAWAFNQKLVSEPGAKFIYSNTGYLVLGAIIEEATGKRYAPYCREAVLAPLGVAGELEPNWRVMWSYGGWRMTADDYLTFLDLFDAEDRKLGATAKSWMLEPKDKAAGGDDELWYGLGTYARKAGNGVNVRHFGSWVYNTMGKDGPLKTSLLTLAVRQSDGTAWFVYASPRPPTDHGRPGVELERELLAAYRGVKRWN
jgi:CubicO group peptidase (beta-lactamase class C family)